MPAAAKLPRRKYARASEPSAIGSRRRSDTIELREHPQALSTKRRSKGRRGRGNDPGCGKNDKDTWAIRSQVLQPPGQGCSSETKW